MRLCGERRISQRPNRWLRDFEQFRAERRSEGEEERLRSGVIFELTVTSRARSIDCSERDRTQRRRRSPAFRRFDGKVLIMCLTSPRRFSILRNLRAATRVSRVRATETGIVLWRGCSTIANGKFLQNLRKCNAGAERELRVPRSNCNESLRDSSGNPRRFKLYRVA